MAIEIPDDFEVFEGSGVQVLRPRRRLGQQQEPGRVLGNAHHLRANLAQRTLLARDESHDPPETADSGSDAVVYELEVQVSQGRYGGAATGISWLVEAEQAIITIECLDRDTPATMLASGTSSVTTRASNSGTLDPEVRAFWLRISMRAQAGQTAKLYRVRVQELALTDPADLELNDFIPLDASSVASGQGRAYGAFQVDRWVDQIDLANQHQMIAAGWALRADRPVVCGAIEPKVAEWIRSISPEADELLMFLQYRVTGPGVEVRFSVGLRGETRGSVGDWQALSASTGRRSHQDQISLQPVHAARLGVYGLQLEVRSTVSTDPADEFTYTIKAGGKVNSGSSLELDSDPLNDFDEMECAQVRFYDSGGSEIETEISYQVQRFAASQIYLYPWLGADLNEEAASVKIIRAGTLEVYGLFAEELHGLPYASHGRRFLWNDGDTAKAAIQPGASLGAAPHLILYGAQQYLFARRTPYLAWGLAPNQDQVLTQRAWAQRTLGAGFAVPVTDWHTLAQTGCGGDVTFARRRSGATTRHQRRALEVYAVVIISSSRAARTDEGRRDENYPIPLEFRLRRRLADGTQTVVSDAARLEAVSANIQGSITQQKEAVPASGERRGATNLDGLYPAREWGKAAYPLLLEIMDAEATEGEVLEFQVTAVDGEEYSLNGPREGEWVRISMASWCVRPAPLDLWSEISVEL